jgi:hypothetical protein
MSFCVCVGIFKHPRNRLPSKLGALASKEGRDEMQRPRAWACQKFVAPLVPIPCEPWRNTPVTPEKPMAQRTKVPLTPTKDDQFRFISFAFYRDEPLPVGMQVAGKENGA